jgi:hypothetical protein
MKTKIYALRDDAGSIRYIGKTGKTLQSRLTEHLYEAKRGDKNHRCTWLRSLLNEGTLPSITLIEEVDGDGCAAEISWIRYFRDHGVRLTNGTDGGEGCVGRIVSEETRRKTSLALKGIKRSEETRRKISISKRRENLSDETIYKRSAAQKGRKYSEEVRRNMSIAHIGRKPSEETKQKLSLINKGKKLSEEHKLKMSIAQKARRK